MAIVFSALALMGVGVAPPEALSSGDYAGLVKQCLDNLIAQGRDRYGDIQTPMFMSVIDPSSGASPREPAVLDGMVRSEGRLHRRNPGGADLWDDQPLLRALYAAGEFYGDSRYTRAADDYIRIYFQRAVRPNGLLSWGTHVYYDAFKDRPGGDQDGAGPHEILVLCPLWDRMWNVTPEGVRKEIEGLWDWHVVDKTTGVHNRHDDRQIGCDFAFSGGEFIYAFAFLFSRTKDPRHLEWAKTVASHHWNARNPETNLAPDAPSTSDRYDATHCFTTVSGPHAALLLKAFEVSGDVFFRDLALAYIKAYLKHGWDAEARRWHAMLTLDGAPVREQAKGEAYDAWKPTGYVDIWRTTMYSYEFPIEAAQTAVYAYEVTGDTDALESARCWAENIRAEMPPHLGRRWRQEILDVLPDAHQGTYAENYGRAASFFLHLHYATGEPSHLDTARALADEAVRRLYASGWFKGHPSKPYYESTDGVGYLLYALLELAAYPNRKAPNL